MNARLREDSRIEHLRVPPHSIEAEQSVLGALMLSQSPEHSKRVWSDVAELLTAESFYRRDHALIWEAIANLQKRERPTDAVTVGEWFEANRLAEHVAGGAYLIELASTTPSAANIRAYAEIVADKHQLRQLIQAGTEMVNAGFNPDGRDTVEIIGQAQSRVGSLLDHQPCDLEPIAPVMQRVFERVTERYHRGGGVHGLTTGLDDLDQLINGLKPGGLYLLAARPKMGKTTLAQNIAEFIALEHKKPVAVFSFEMQAEELGDRMLSSQGDIDADRVRRGDLDDADWANVTAVMRRLRAAQIFVSRPRVARVEHVVAQARRQHARTPLGLIVIDYLQLMQTSGDNRAQGIGDITRALKLLAGEIGVPVLLLSQLNRDLEKRVGDKRPIPADLRDSGAIEQDADAVMFIYRDEVYDRNSRWKGTAEIIVALQRNGPPGEVRVRYRPDRFRFENLPDGWEPEPLPPKEEQGTSKPRGFGKSGNKRADAAAGDA
jgi:replicative DNA helicase